MFHEAADVRWFQPVELSTADGKVGHIKMPVGTHGHYKATFESTVSQADTIKLNLYKRQFPKWTHQPSNDVLGTDVLPK